MKINRIVILFALVFAVVIAVTRMLIVDGGGVFLSLSSYADLVYSVIAEFLVGVLIGLVVLSINRTTCSVIAFLLLAGVVVLLDIVFFHYEAVFGRLPGADVLYYVTEIGHLESSLDANLPVVSVVVQFALVMACLFAAFHVLKKQSGKPGSRLTSLAGMFLIVTAAVLQSVPSFVPERYFWSSREPLIWLVQSGFIKKSYNLGELRLSSDDFGHFRELHLGENVMPPKDMSYPLCSTAERGSLTGNKRNLIVLILEGVTDEFLEVKINNRMVMPNLIKMVEENLYFKNTYAPGTKSVTALPAIFSGIPANPFNNYLWNDPPVSLTGFPGRLEKLGYKTAYFHGGDLSFERQRSYLKKAGFSTIYEYDSDIDHEVYAWGYDDGVMFDELRKWITEKEKQNVPYLASLFTLSTHDPYVLPPDWEPRFFSRDMLDEDSGSFNVNARIIESYAFLDHHLGKFYQWYLERKDDTILAIMADHAPHVMNDIENGNSNEMSFDVPLVIAGLSQKEIESYRSYTDRVGGLHDVPATLMALLNLPPHQCNLGVNLLQPEEDWPENRLVYSFGGDSLEQMHLWFDGEEVVFDRVRNEIGLPGKDPVKFTNSDEGSPPVQAARQYINNLFPVHYYLLAKDAYYPARDKRNEGITGLKEPIYVSHRGNIHGADSHMTENSRQALDQVIKSAFKWMEVDVQLTGDKKLVIHHDPYIEINGEKKPLSDLSLKQIREYPDYSGMLTLEQAVAEYSPRINMLIEIKDQINIHDLMHLSREVVRILKSRKQGKKVIVDSFSPYLVNSIKHDCDCEVGFDAAYRKSLDEGNFEYISEMNVDWVYLHHSVIDAATVATAHEYGLKVMAYTVNDQAIIDRWKQNHTMPDGIITDYEKIVSNNQYSWRKSQ